MTEVAVYRDHARIHHRAYSGPELTLFWSTLVSEISE